MKSYFSFLVFLSVCRPFRESEKLLINLILLWGKKIEEIIICQAPDTQPLPHF